MVEKPMVLVVFFNSFSTLSTEICFVFEPHVYFFSKSANRPYFVLLLRESSIAQILCGRLGLFEIAAIFQRQPYFLKLCCFKSKSLVSFLKGHKIFFFEEINRFCVFILFVI